jgi:hypothetical protein
MPELSVNRTLVKSPPELWSELSEVERLANHLGEFGEITISRLDPEHTVAWEGEHACGSVELEASGWGTKVTMKAEVREPERDEPPASVRGAQPAPPPPPRPTVHQMIPDLEAWDRSAAEIESHAQRQTAAAQRAAERAAERAQRERKRGFARWLFRGRRAEPEPAPAAPSPPPPPAPPTRSHWSDAVQAPAPRVPPPPPAPAPAAAPEAKQPAVDEKRARAVLAAHHRPFSRG